MATYRSGMEAYKEGAYSAPPASCFFCENPPDSYWRGNDGYIAVCLDCSIRVLPKLICDARCNHIEDLLLQPKIAPAYLKDCLTRKHFNDFWQRAKEQYDSATICFLLREFRARQSAIKIDLVIKNDGDPTGQRLTGIGD